MAYHTALWKSQWNKENVEIRISNLPFQKTTKANITWTSYWPSSINNSNHTSVSYIQGSTYHNHSLGEIETEEKLSDMQLSCMISCKRTLSTIVNWCVLSCEPTTSSTKNSYIFFSILVITKITFRLETKSQWWYPKHLRRTDGGPTEICVFSHIVPHNPLVFWKGQSFGHLRCISWLAHRRQFLIISVFKTVILKQIWI